MKAIKFTKFDENGICKGATATRKRFTVRGAMEHLRGMGFKPIFDNGNKLQYHWTNGAYNAWIF